MKSRSTQPAFLNTTSYMDFPTSSGKGRRGEGPSCRCMRGHTQDICVPPPYRALVSKTPRLLLLPSFRPSFFRSIPATRVARFHTTPCSAPSQISSRSPNRPPLPRATGPAPDRARAPGQLPEPQLQGIPMISERWGGACCDAWRNRRRIGGASWPAIQQGN